MRADTSSEFSVVFSPDSAVHLHCQSLFRIDSVCEPLFRILGFFSLGSHSLHCVPGRSGVAMWILSQHLFRSHFSESVNHCLCSRGGITFLSRLLIRELISQSVFLHTTHFTLSTPFPNLSFRYLTFHFLILTLSTCFSFWDRDSNSPSPFSIDFFSCSSLLKKFISDTSPLCLSNREVVNVILDTF